MTIIFIDISTNRVRFEEDSINFPLLTNEIKSLECFRTKLKISPFSQYSMTISNLSNRKKYLAF